MTVWLMWLRRFIFAVLFVVVCLLVYCATWCTLLFVLFVVFVNVLLYMVFVSHFVVFVLFLMSTSLFILALSLSRVF